MGTSIARSILGAAALACVMAGYPPARGRDEKTFRGEIADTQCALNVHSLSQSHKEMIAMRPEVKTNADCARYCVKERGGRFVLETTDKVYKLDTQALAEQWAGLKVRIVGTLDPKTDIISVRSIEPVSRARAKHYLRSDGQRFESAIPGDAKTPPPRIVVVGDRNHNKSRHKSCGYSSLDFRNYF